MAKAPAPSKTSSSTQAAFEAAKRRAGASLLPARALQLGGSQRPSTIPSRRPRGSKMKRAPLQSAPAMPNTAPFSFFIPALSSIVKDARSARSSD
ncbi:MAG TPA: hypothetical protein DCW29_06465 [Janthinobacterium sp.]|nr:hypothetical protein [Janthinobacterium sp.]